MEKLWNCAYNYGIMYADQRIFKKREDADKWFDTVINNNKTSIDEEEMILIKSGNSMTYYNGNELLPLVISCQLVSVE